MKTQPLDELYFEWLYSQVADLEAEDPSLTYFKLLKKLFTKEAVWIVPNDDNRLEDGKDLRFEFIREKHVGASNREWADLGCSVLELMMGLSRKLEFEAGGEPHYWFWKMIENLKLRIYSDDRPFPEQLVDDILDMMLWRTYKKNGRGGLFPLRRTQKDQTKIELWYQAAEYVQEQH